DRLKKEMCARDLLLLILGLHGALASQALEKLGLRAFMYGEFVSALVKELNELMSPERDEAQDSVLKVNHQGRPTRTVGLRETGKRCREDSYEVRGAVHTGGCKLSAGGRLFLFEVTAEDAGGAADDYGGCAPHHRQHCESVQ
ncbi:putative retrotransposon hot spot (RHS) protein, partial [Trypanosoma cruzi]